MRRKDTGGFAYFAGQHETTTSEVERELAGRPNLAHCVIGLSRKTDVHQVEKTGQLIVWNPAEKHDPVFQTACLTLHLERRQPGPVADNKSFDRVITQALDDLQ